MNILYILHEEFQIHQFNIFLNLWWQALQWRLLCMCVFTGFFLIAQRMDRSGIHWKCCSPGCLHKAVCRRATQYRPDSHVWAGEEQSEYYYPLNPHGYLPRRRQSADRSSSTAPFGRVAHPHRQPWNKPRRRRSRDQRGGPWMYLWRIRLSLRSLYGWLTQVIRTVRLCFKWNCVLSWLSVQLPCSISLFSGFGLLAWFRTYHHLRIIRFYLTF